jgi:hypothetical protein
MQYVAQKPGSMREISVSVVDPGSFSHIQDNVLHFVPREFLPECPRTTSKYLQKLSYSYEG